MQPISAFLLRVPLRGVRMIGRSCVGAPCSPILLANGNNSMARLGPAVILAIVLAAPIVAHAGGVDMTDEDLNGGVDGPSFFGFVRLVGGAGIDDAKVTAELKGGALVTATDLLGLYKIPGFGKDVNPDDVQISCAKDGYKQANVMRHPHTPGDMKDPIEVDCFLQKQ